MGILIYNANWTKWSVICICNSMIWSDIWHKCHKWYSKHPHIRTHDFGGQADWVLIYRVLNDKSASKCS